MRRPEANFLVVALLCCSSALAACEPFPGLQLSCDAVLQPAKPQHVPSTTTEPAGQHACSNSSSSTASLSAEACSSTAPKTSLPPRHKKVESLYDLPLFQYVQKSVLLKQWKIAAMDGLNDRDQDALLRALLHNSKTLWKHVACAQYVCYQESKEHSMDVCRGLVSSQGPALALAAAYVGPGIPSCAIGTSLSVLTGLGRGTNVLQNSLQQLYGPGSWGSTFLVRIAADLAFPDNRRSMGPYNAFASAKYSYSGLFAHLDRNGFAARIYHPEWFVGDVPVGYRFAAGRAAAKLPNTTYMLERVLEHSIASSVLETFHKHVTSAPAMQQCSNISDWFDAQLSLTPLGRACVDAIMPWSLPVVPREGDTLPVALVGHALPPDVVASMPWDDYSAVAKVMRSVVGFWSQVALFILPLLWHAVTASYIVSLWYLLRLVVPAAVRLLKAVGWVSDRSTRRQQSTAKLARQAARAGGPHTTATNNNTTIAGSSSRSSSGSEGRAAAASSSTRSALSNSVARRRCPAGSSNSSSSSSSSRNPTAGSSRCSSQCASDYQASHAAGSSGGSVSAASSGPGSGFQGGLAKQQQAASRVTTVPASQAQPQAQPAHTSGVSRFTGHLLHLLGLPRVRCLAACCTQLLVEGVVLPVRLGAAAVWGMCRDVGAAAAKAARAMVV